MTTLIRWTCVTMGLMLCLTAARGQLNSGGVPLALQAKYSSLTDNPPAVAVPVPTNFPDQQAAATKHVGGSPMGLVIPHVVNSRAHGRWQPLPDGGQLWRCVIESASAKGITLYFDQFRLPTGYRLFAYRPDGAQVLGAFTHRNNHPSGRFAIGLIHGSQVVLELYRPPNSTAREALQVSEVGHAYQHVGAFRAAQRDFGDADPCQVNINCSEGTPWQDLKRSVTRILVKDGSDLSWCTGSLINNQRNDCTPYLLTAEHCMGTASANDLEQWIFYFNYEAPGCANPANEGNLDNQSLIGATLVATSEDGGGDTGSDFTLLTLNDPIPDTYAPYFAGWNRLDVASPGGASIHHPDGDIKKISTYTSPLTSTSFGGITPNTHWSVTWVATANGHGVTEAGSSGSALYNLSGQIVGTETGGTSFCTAPNDPDEYGKFSYHWESNGNGAANRLSNWLDPDNTGLNQLAGREGDCSITSVVPVVVAGPQARLFPNPAQDQVVLEWAVNAPIQVTAYDALGSVITTATAKTAQAGRIVLATADWPAGVYMLSATAGNLRWNGRLVVQP